MACAPCGNNSATCAVSAMAYTIQALLLEADDALERFWFVRDSVIVEQQVLYCPPMPQPLGRHKAA